MSDKAKSPVVEKTATAALMRAMEDFGESEPKFVLVIYLNEANELCWMRSDASATETMGVLELVKAQVQHDWLNHGD